MKLFRRLGNINAGFLKDRCTLMQPTYTPDGRGGQTVTYTAIEEVWCGSVPGAGNRKIDAEQYLLYDYLTLYIRYNSYITPDFQIIFRGITYTISNVTDVEQRFQYYEINLYSKKLSFPTN